MGKARRVLHVISGVFAILLGLLMVISGGDAYRIVLIILELTLIFRGIGFLSYYFTMARHMVGGRVVFYQGVFMLDIGLFIAGLHNLPRVYAMIYLVLSLAIDGAVDLLRTREILRLESKRWKYQVFTGTVKIAISVVCMLFFDSPAILCFIYGFGLVHSGVARISAGVRRSAIVYIN